MPKNEHPLGLGLRDNYSLSPDEGGRGGPKFRIPKIVDGLNLLRSITERNVLDLKPEERRAAWHVLLNKPSLCAPLRPPSQSGLLAAGFPVSDVAASKLRAVALAVVIRGRTDSQRDALDVDSYSEARIAGVGQLVVVTADNNAAVSLDAWADIRWVRSARALSIGLENLYKAATPAAQRMGRRRSEILLLGDELADSIEAHEREDIESALSVIAAVHGYELRVLQRPRRHTGNVLDALRAMPPSLLVVAAPPGPEIEAIVSEYRDSASAPRISHIGNSSSTELIDNFRDEMGAASGVSPALTLLSGPDALEEGNRSQPRFHVPGVWPVRNQGQRQLHDSFGVFIESLEDGRWYTRDKSGHAGSAIKRYRRVGRRLEHEADIGADGKEMAKHKGYIGETVNLNEMRGI